MLNYINMIPNEQITRDDLAVCALSFSLVQMSMFLLFFFCLLSSRVMQAGSF